MHQLALLLLQQDQPDSNQVMGMLAAIMAVYAIVILIALVVVIIPTWFISKKAGFSPWLSLINIVPTFGLLIWLYVLAFSEWKTAPAPSLAAWQPPPPPAPPQA